MIEEKDLTPVGKFQKTHALKGELNAILDIDPEYFAEGHPLIVNVEGTFVPFYTESVRGKGSTTSLIKLTDVDTQEEAQGLVNETIYADKAAVREFMADEDEEFMLEEDLEGYRVVDEEFGEIGVLERVDSTTQNTLFVVKDSEGEEIYIPVVDDFIVAINEEDKEILTNLPEELINLNQKKL